MPLPRLPKPIPAHPTTQITQQIIKHQRKVAHNVIERRYRNNINDRIAELRSVVPALNSPRVRDAKGAKRHREDDGSDSDGDNDPSAEILDGIPAATKLNKATILRKSTEYILYLKHKATQFEAENAALRELVHRLGGGEMLRHMDAAAQAQSSSAGSASSGSPPPSSPDAATTEEEDGNRSPLRLQQQQPQQGVRLMAVMLMCACVLYAPSPFEDGRGRHVYSRGKVVEDVGGGGAGVGVEHGSIIKFLFATLCMLNFLLNTFSPRRRSVVTAKAATASAAAANILASPTSSSYASLAQQLASLTGNRVPSTRMGLVVGVVWQGVRFVVMGSGLGRVVEKLVRVGDKERKEYFGAVAGVAGRVFEAVGHGKEDASVLLRLYLALRTLNYARVGGVPHDAMSRTYILSAIHIRIASTRCRYPYIRSLLRMVAHRFWCVGLAHASESKPSTSTDTAWVTAQDTTHLTHFFDTATWVPSLTSSSTTTAPR
ncbi:hypothetical protein HK104_007036, partial [Borealophlyctis nickersoniae]